MIRRDSKKHEMESNTQEKSKNIVRPSENLEKQISKDDHAPETPEDVVEAEPTKTVDISGEAKSAGNVKCSRKSLNSNDPHLKSEGIFQYF